MPAHYWTAWNLRPTNLAASATLTDNPLMSAAEAALETPEHVAEEARHLSKLYEGSEHLLVPFLSGQLSIVKQQAQMLVGLCGLAVTVTGFSGAHMIRAGTTAAVTMVVGIFLILVGLVLCLRVLSQLRWVSQDLQDDLAATAALVIQRRNLQQHHVAHAGVFVAVGLACYLAAVMLAALVSGNALPG